VFISHLCSTRGLKKIINWSAFLIEADCWSRYSLLLLKSTAGPLSSIKCHKDNWDNTDSMTHLQHYPSITGEICENAKIKRGKSQYFIKMVECHLKRVPWGDESIGETGQGLHHWDTLYHCVLTEPEPKLKAVLLPSPHCDLLLRAIDQLELTKMCQSPRGVAKKDELSP